MDKTKATIKLCDLNNKALAEESWAEFLEHGEPAEEIQLFVSMINKWYIKIKIKFYNVETSEPLRQPSGLTRCPHFLGNSCAAATLMPASSALLLPLLLIMLHKHSGLSLITDLRGSQQLSGTSRLPLRYLRQGASRFRQ